MDKIVYIQILFLNLRLNLKLENFHNILFKNLRWGLKIQIITKNNKLFYEGRYHLSKKVEIKTKYLKIILKVI